MDNNTLVFSLQGVRSLIFSYLMTPRMQRCRACGAVYPKLQSAIIKQSNIFTVLKHRAVCTDCYRRPAKKTTFSLKEEDA